MRAQTHRLSLRYQTMRVHSTVSRTSKAEKKNRRINREYIILMKEKAKPERNVPSGIIF